MCKHLIKDEYCKAFPDGIPEDIWDGYNYKERKYPSRDTSKDCGNGYKFEPYEKHTR